MKGYVEKSMNENELNEVLNTIKVDRTKQYADMTYLYYTGKLIFAYTRVNTTYSKTYLTYKNIATTV